MPTVTINVTRVERVNPNNSKIVEITATQGDSIITRTIDIAQFSGVSDFATWLINQQPDRQNEPNWTKQLTVTFHTSGSGTDLTRIVDSVTVGSLP